MNFSPDCEIILWKNLVQEQHIYNIQFISSSIKDTSKMMELLKDWKQIAEGYNNNGKEVYIFTKTFQDSFEWDKWYKEAPKRLANSSYSSNNVQVVDKPVSNITEKTSGRRCGICGKSGHYRSTCDRMKK